MPDLLGHFPLDISMCLRALALHHLAVPGAQRKSKGGPARQDDQAMRDTLAVLFQRPFYVEQDAGLLQQVQHLFRFSVEYLLQAGAISLEGKPVGELPAAAGSPPQPQMAWQTFQDPQIKPHGDMCSGHVQAWLACCATCTGPTPPTWPW